jgi:hypothetical protein
MAILTKSQLAASKTQQITIADWGGEIIIRPLSGRERQDIATFAASDAGKQAPIRMQAMAVAFACVEPAFDSADEVLELSGKGIEEAFQAVIKASGIGDAADAVGN